MSLTEIFPLFHTTLWEFIHHLHPVPQTVLKKWPKKIIFKITSSLRYNKHFNHVVSGNIEEVNVYDLFHCLLFQSVLSESALPSGICLCADRVRDKRGRKNQSHHLEA